MRVPDNLENIPTEQLSRHASDDMLIFTSILALMISLILLWLGKQGKQGWIILWSAGLLLCSIGMGGYLVMERFNLLPA